jgi:Fic family protein
MRVPLSTAEWRWVGGKTPFTARYICPPAELVAQLMDNWLTFVNSSLHSPETTAIIGHCRLVSIHPFLEGNGRTARLFLDATLEKAYGDRVPLLAYHLSTQCPVKGYVEALKLLNVGDLQGFSHPFWRDAIQWGDKIQAKIAAILLITKKRLSGKIGMYRMSPASLKLINHLWSQPIVCHAGLLELFNRDFTQVEIAINELTRVGILQKRNLRAPKNTLIYDCSVIFEAYQTMDDAVFIGLE